MHIELLLNHDNYFVLIIIVVIKLIFLSFHWVTHV